MNFNDPIRILLALEEIEAIFNSQSDAHQILDQILKKLLELFSCDRAWLLYPCNPDSPTFEVAYERTTPSFPGAKALNATVPMTRDMAEYCNRALSNNGYPEINVSSDQKRSNDRALQFDVKSRIFMALKPKNDDAWLFGMHHCAINHHWSDDERYLFKIIGQRITNLLENLILIKQTTESEQKYRKLFETVSDAIYLISEKGKIIDANQGACTCLGRKKEEILGLYISDVDQNFSVEEFLSFWDKVPFNKPKNFESIHKTKNNDLISIDIIGQKIRFENTTCYYGVARDITGRKKIEKVLKESEERFRNLMENVDAVAVQGYGLDGTTQYWNKASERLYGYTRQEAIGRSLLDLIIPPEMRDAVTEEMRKMVETGQPVPSGELLLMHKDGSRVPVISHHTIVEVPGRERELFCLDIDITERKQAEAEREKLQEQLNQAQKMEAVGRLAGGVAHDFNNMLGVILGYVEFASEKIDSRQDLYSDLKEIQKAAQRSADLTKQLLTFARKQIIAPKVLDLNDTVDSMLKMLRRLIGEDIDLLWLPADQLWPVKVDPSQIDQILANLCVNARDAITDVGKLTIETQMKTFDQADCLRNTECIPGDYVMLSVTDSGCGMNKETLDNLFEPFFTTKEIGKGTGLGLAIIYGIVKQNKGFINVYSEPGQGTTFKIYLPRFHTSEETQEKTLTAKPAPIGNETILLVEDEPAILELAKMMLERKGYLVLPAGTPAEAITIADTYVGKIDLLMTDVVMPEMNGRDLAKKITALFPEIKLLFMSGYSANVITQQEVLDDGVAFMEKPFSMNELAEKIRGVLDDSPS